MPALSAQITSVEARKKAMRMVAPIQLPKVCHLRSGTTSASAVARIPPFEGTMAVSAYL
jgi:hypothetical protein